jgi:hypothetical protein
MSCHTDRCPTGIATQDPVRRNKLGRLHAYLERGQLLRGSLDDERLAVFKVFWEEARADSFEAPARIVALRRSKLQ